MKIEAVPIAIDLNASQAPARASGEATMTDGRSLVEGFTFQGFVCGMCRTKEAKHFA